MSGKTQAAQTHSGKNDTQCSSLRSPIRSHEDPTKQLVKCKQRFQLQQKAHSAFTASQQAHKLKNR